MPPAVTTLKNGAVYIETAAGALSAIEVGPGPGNMSISGFSAGQVELLPVMNRGEYLEAVEGPQTFLTFTITVTQRGYLTDATNRTILDSILATGKASADGTVDAGGAVHTVNVYWIGSRSGNAARMDLPNCRVSIDFAEAAEGNTLSISGTCYGRPTFS
jgi:hypothetical protein